MSGIARRLVRLEKAASLPETMYAWAGTETLADAIARQLPQGAPDGVALVVYRWADADQ